MHFHLPKPIHGWRAFIGEVGVIVLGVLIALGAEQVADAVRWQYEVDQFRRAIQAEIATDQAAFQYRLRQGPCVQRRLAELQHWHDAAGAGKVLPLFGQIGRPSITSLNATVWDTRGDVMAHMPLNERLNYAYIYNAYANVALTLDQEREAWRGLAGFNGVRAATVDSLMRMSELLYRAQTTDKILRGNWQQAEDRAAKLGIRPDFGTSRPYIPPPDPEFCKPLLPSARAS